MKKFPNGFYFDRPSPKAPEYIIGNVKIEVDSFKKWLDENRNGDFVRIILKNSRDGRYYPELDTYDPKNNRPEFMKQETRSALDKDVAYPSEEIKPEDIPF